MCQQGYIPSGEFRGEMISCLFQFLEAACIPWFMVPSSIFKAYHSNLYFHLHISSFHLKIFTLIISAKSLLPRKIRSFLLSRIIQDVHIFGSYYSAYHNCMCLYVCMYVRMLGPVVKHTSYSEFWLQKIRNTHLDPVTGSCEAKVLLFPRLYCHSKNH